jgi:uncharacterized protein (TIGR02569 family)
VLPGLPERRGLSAPRSAVYDRAVCPTAPPHSVLTAFGAVGSPEPLPGGQGTSWRAGAIVLKPLDGLPEAVEWQANVLAEIRATSIRVAPPIRARDGRMVVDGWTAWKHVDGHHAERRWPDIIAAGTQFHHAFAGVPRPQFIARYDDPWAIGDRVAWGEHPIDEFKAVPHIARLRDRLRPVDTPSQVIHGDLTGNVLFSDSFLRP